MDKAENSIMFCFYPLYVKWSHSTALLTALCRKDGIDTALCILSDGSAFDAAISAFKGRFVAFSCVTEEDYRECVPFIEKAKLAGKTTLLGGVWAGLGKPVSRSIDFVCRGDGETLPRFILQGDDGLFKTKMRWANLNDLPLPDYEIFKDVPFNRDFPFTKGKKIIPYVSSRGCTAKCSFCQAQLQDRTLRIRRKVGEDLSYLKERYNPELFWIGDATAPYFDRAWRASWKGFRHPFACYIRADIEPELLEWLIDRGMVACAFGVESGDEQYRNEVLKKNLTNAELVRTVGILQANKVDYVPFYMTGTLGETFMVRSMTAKAMRLLGGYPVLWEYKEL